MHLCSANWKPDRQVLWGVTTQNSLTSQSLGVSLPEQGAKSLISTSKKMFTTSTTHVKHNATPTLYGCLVISLQMMLIFHVAVDECVKPVVSPVAVYFTVHVRSKKWRHFEESHLLNHTFWWFCYTSVRPSSRNVPTMSIRTNDIKTDHFLPLHKAETNKKI